MFPQLFCCVRWYVVVLAEQGQLQMWVDMLTPAEAAKYKATDISPPLPEELEVRRHWQRGWLVSIPH